MRILLTTMLLDILSIEVVKGIPLVVFLGAAVVDSINPCAFGVLIFLLSYLLKTSTSKTKLLINGLTYIFAVFLTYLGAGLLLKPVIGGLGQFSIAVYGVLGVLTILAGLLEIKDFFWYGKGFSLQLLPGASQRIKMYTNKISGNIWSAFGLGVFVALVELPCTGAVYLAILTTMSLSGYSPDATLFLIIYNLIFILPLVVILFAFWGGLSAKKIEQWRQKHKGLMRLLIGVSLLLLGGWMLQQGFF